MLAEGWPRPFCIPECLRQGARFVGCDMLFEIITIALRLFQLFVGPQGYCDVVDCFLLSLDAHFVVDVEADVDAVAAYRLFLARQRRTA